MKRNLIVTPLDWAINPESIAQGFTQSELQTFDNCAEKWYLGYNLMLAKRGQFSWALTYGSWMHAALEEWYSTKGKRYTWEPELDKKLLPAKLLSLEDYYVQLGHQQMKVYTSFYKNDFKMFEILGVEEHLEVHFEGFILKGMIDLPVRLKHHKHKPVMIMDHKTTSKLDREVALGWDFRFQFMFYCWLYQKAHPEVKVAGFIPNGIKKTQLKQTQKDGSLEGFMDRVNSDMRDRHEMYFYRDLLWLTKGALKRFEETILRPKLFRLQFLRDPKLSKEAKIAFMRNKNTDHCRHYGNPCQFLPACQHGLKIEQFQYMVRDVKHQELEDESVTDE